jgi:hypothetical protein
MSAGRTSRWLERALLALAVTVSATHAEAQDAGQLKRFAAAQNLFDDGAYTPSYQEFKALADETGSPNAELYVARCLRELGRLPEAYEATAVALRHATAKAERDPKYVSTRNAAATDLAKLEPRVGRLVVAVADAPAELSVTVNGAPLAREKLGLPAAVAPGEVVVRVTAAGKRDVERRLALNAGDAATVTLALESSSAPVASGPKPEAPPAASAATSTTTGGGGRVAGFVVAGVGVAGMAGFAVLGLMANHRYDTIAAQCGNTHCTDPAFASEIDGGRKLDLGANIGLGVGIAGLAAGALLIALGGPKRSAPHVSAWVAPTGGGVVLNRAF